MLCFVRRRERQRTLHADLSLAVARDDGRGPMRGTTDGSGAVEFVPQTVFLELIGVEAY